MVANVRIVLALATLAALGAAPPDDALVLTAGSRIPFEVNKTSGQMLIDPGISSYALCNPDFAVKAHFRSTWTGPIFRIDSVLVPGGGAPYRFKMGGRTFDSMTRWSYQRFVSEADCGIGPGGLPQPVIRFVLHAPRSGERVGSLPFLVQSGLDDGGIDGRIDVGGKTIGVEFDLRPPLSRVTASAAWPIAAAQGGVLHGPILQTPIAFGVARPVQEMVLLRPLEVGPLQIRSVYVRVADYGDASHIRTKLDPDEFDPDAITVTGRVKHSKEFQRLRVGAADLAGCSSITFDKPRQQIILSCV